ncbi:hypothetical protein QTN25_007952 [Entamoeba marina]
MTHEFTEKNISDYLETTDSYELLKFAIDRLYYNNEFDNYNDLKTWVAEQITPYVNNPDIRNELDFNNLLGSLNSLNDRNMIYDLIEEVDNKTLKTFTDNYLNVRTVGVISNDLRKTIANQVTEFVNIPRIENQIEFANFFDSLVEVYDKNTKAYNNFINNTIDERNIYDLLEGYENDKLRLFATEYLNYNDEFDDYDTLKGWIASQLKEYMNNIENKEDFNIGRPLNTLVDKITNDKKELNNLIDDRINKDPENSNCTTQDQPDILPPRFPVSSNYSPIAMPNYIYPRFPYYTPAMNPPYVNPLNPMYRDGNY